MKENVLDVLMYLFETYMDTETDPEPDRGLLQQELQQAGFGDQTIEAALTWLDDLASADHELDGELSTDQALRVFDSRELARLDAGARGYVLYLEQAGILSPAQRELVIDRLMALDADDIDSEQVKWVVLMVLFSQPGQEAAYARMEDLVFEEHPSTVH